MTAPAPDRADDAATPPPVLTLADKLDRVWKTMHPQDRTPFTYREVSEGVKALGVIASPSYLIQLRHGTRDNPTIRQIEALAKFFHVPMTYFFGTSEEVETVDAQMTLVRAMRSPAVRDLALRASSLTPAGLRAIAHIVDELQSVQGMSTRRDRRRNLPEPPPPPGGADDDSAVTWGSDHAPERDADPLPPRSRKRRS